MKIYGKKRALASLENYRRSGRFPHALLITGENGIGKSILADYAAMLYLCKSGGIEPCMTCNECRRTEEHIHPDVVYPLSLCGGKYKLDALRDMIADGYIKPNDGDVRIYIFERLDEMSAACQNALLKFIEEPLDFNRYIFTAAKKANILTTVLSRVTALECDGVTREEYFSALSENGISRDKTEEYYRLFGGNIGNSLKTDKNPAFTENFGKTAEITEAIISGKEAECLRIFESLKTRDDIFEVLGMLSDIFASAAVLKSGINNIGAFGEQIKKISSHYRLKAVNDLYDETCRLCAFNTTMVNAKLFAAECCAALFNAAEKDRNG